MAKIKVKLKKDKTRTEWPEYIAPNKIPYVSHVPASPNEMTDERKARIRSVIYWHNRGKKPKWIAEKVSKKFKKSISSMTVKRDLTTAVELTNRAMPYVPKIEKEIMKEVKTSIVKAQDIFSRVDVVLKKLEDEEKHVENPKAIMAYAMLIGELRQSLELNAKLSGELQTGTRVNVLVFSGLVKGIIHILESELDLETFRRIRDRIKLEMDNREPLGARGGPVVVEEGEIVNG